MEISVFQGHLCNNAVFKEYCIDTDIFNLSYLIQGSGKTYTIGDGISSFTDDEYGIIPRALKAIFDNMQVNKK